MKKLLILPLLLLACGVYSQMPRIDAVKWIADDLGYLSFYQDAVHFNFDGNERAKRFTVANDTLIMVDNYTSSADNFSKSHIDLFKFLIQHIDARTLTLVPFDANAKKLAARPLYQFKNLAYCLDTGIKFTRLHFTAGTCYGRCPVLNMDVDNKGNYYVTGGLYAEPYKGRFKGTLTAKQLDSLNYLLQHSELKKMHTWKQGNMVQDAPDYSLTIYSNNPPLKINTNEPPLNLTDLINFLVSSYKNVLLTPDAETHVLKDN